MGIIGQLPEGDIYGTYSCAAAARSLATLLRIWDKTALAQDSLVNKVSNDQKHFTLKSRSSCHETALLQDLKIKWA
jgi:hypothetical protein